MAPETKELPFPRNAATYYLIKKLSIGIYNFFNNIFVLVDIFNC